MGMLEKMQDKREGWSLWIYKQQLAIFGVLEINEYDKNKYGQKLTRSSVAKLHADTFGVSLATVNTTQHTWLQMHELRFKVLEKQYKKEKEYLKELRENPNSESAVHSYKVDYELKYPTQYSEETGRNTQQTTDW